jgi:hypothetical protein
MFNDIEYMPSQAADMLAWSIRRQLDPDQSFNKEWDWIYPELYKLNWGGYAFTKESWQSLSKILGI